MASKTDEQAHLAHVADSHDLIRVHGARENNLEDVDVELPKRRGHPPTSSPPARRSPAEHLAAYAGA